jgi:hypothetical protein
LNEQARLFREALEAIEAELRERVRENRPAFERRRPGVQEYDLLARDAAQAADARVGTAESTRAHLDAELENGPSELLEQ